MKENLRYMVMQCDSKSLMEQKHKNIKIPIYSFLNQLISSLKKYYKGVHGGDWADYLLGQKKPYYSIGMLTCTWVQHGKTSLECQLLTSFLKNTHIDKIRLYIRLRKYIVQLSNIDMLDEIILKHQDAITIVHRMFDHHHQVKKQIVSGIKKIFISFKITQAKIYACVFVEYVLSIYDSIGCEEQAMMAGGNQSVGHGISGLSSIGNFNSNLHKENGLYRKINHQGHVYSIIDAKFIPKLYKKKDKTNQNQSQYSYYYSNTFSQKSFSFKSPQYFSKQRKIYQKSIKNTQMDEYLSNNASSIKYQQIKQPMKNVQSQIKSSCMKQIVIQQSDQYQNKWDEQHSKQNYRQNESNNSVQIRRMILRNKEFKDRMLNIKTINNSKKLIGYGAGEQHDSIRQTINVIHSSIVRNQRTVQ